MNLIKDDIRSRSVRAYPQYRVDLSKEDVLFIVWCLSLGYSLSNIAGKVMCHRGTVMRWKQRLFQEPYRIFELPVMVKKGERKYLCRFCGGVEPSEIGCKRHVLKHFMPLEYAKQVPLKPPDW